MQSVPSSTTRSSSTKAVGSDSSETKKESKVRGLMTKVAGRLGNVPSQLAGAAESVQGKLSKKFTHSASHSEKQDEGDVYNPQLLQAIEKVDYETARTLMEEKGCR